MTSAQPVRLYIAHNFVEHEDFHKAIEYIESRENFMYVNTASPDIRPDGGKEAEHEELTKQIGLAEIVIVPVNVYKSAPDDIDYQLRVAENFKKPVLGIQGFGETMEVPRALLDACGDIVEWEPRRIVTAIKRLARNEQIGDYEVIEFTLE